MKFILQTLQYTISFNKELILYCNTYITVKYFLHTGSRAFKVIKRTLRVFHLYHQ